MATWRITETTLTDFHLRASFHRDLVQCMTPWFRSITDVRNALLKNALDPTRKDQWEWMRRYERLLIDAGATPFLPHEEIPDARPRKARTAAASAEPEPDEPGEAFVHLE